MEVMIVAGLLAIAIFLWAQLAKNMSDSTKVPDSQVSRDSVGSLIRETLKYKATCQAAMVGSHNSSGFDSASILSGSKEIQLKLPGLDTSSEIIGQNSEVKKIKIKNLKIVNAVAMPSNKYFAQLQMISEGRQGGIALKPLDIGGVYFTASGGAITGCESDTTDPTPLCVEMGCTWNPAVTPSCQCAPIDLVCPAQKYITAIDSSGHPVCTQLGAAVPCPSDRFLASLSIGRSQCKPIPKTPEIDITNAYNDGFGRTPLTAEIAAWLSASQYDNVLAGIKASIVANQGDRDQIITSVYRNGFGRAATAEERTYWNAVLLEGKTIYMDIMFKAREAIVASSATRTSVIENAYQHGFSRSPTAAEINFWTTEMGKGLTTYAEIRKVIQASGGAPFNPYL